MSSGLKTAALLGGLSALFMFIGGALGGQSGMILAFVMALVMNVGSYWFSDKLVLRMYRATEVGPEHPLHPHLAPPTHVIPLRRETWRSPLAWRRLSGT